MATAWRAVHPAHAAEASDYADRYKAERDRLAAVVREAHAAAAELHHASWCSEVLWRGGCSCGVQELTDTLAAAATHQDNKSSVGSGCDGDHGAGTPDPAAAGRPSGRPAPEDCPPGLACIPPPPVAAGGRDPGDDVHPARPEGREGGDVKAITLPINPTPWPAAADKIEGHWTQNVQRDGDRMCLVGGLEACGLAPGEWLIARAVARHRGHAERWNDNRNRTEADVLEWLRSAEPITEDELAEVFGPQWEAVCALVMRAVRLADDEARQLTTAWAAAWCPADDAGAAAWDAAEAAARDAARAAAWTAAWAAARDAAWAAARDAAWDAAEAAAWDAARALVVRDLIGQHGLTQDHYDTLTRPWREVIGPVHPDDGPLP